MMRILVFSLGAVAHGVPHWANEKDSLNLFSADSIMKPVVAMQQKLLTEFNGRRLQASTSGCNKMCPKVMDLSNHTTSEQMALICSDIPGTIGCLHSTSECSAMLQVVVEANASTDVFTAFCKFQHDGCQAKMQNQSTCVGAANMKTWMASCPAAPDVVKNTTVCCPVLKDLVDCMTKPCMKDSMALSMAMGQNQSNAEREIQAKACPDAGVPTMAEVAAVLRPALPSKEEKDHDDHDGHDHDDDHDDHDGHDHESEDAAPAPTASVAAPGQAVSALASVAATWSFLLGN